jgi:hypothetical protein
MPKRLSTVFLQTQPVREILVLDDGSTDDSLDVIPAVAGEWGRQIRLLSSQTNSGSVFAQWRKAAETCTGDLLWIAEADDLCAPRFLAETVSLMRLDPSVRFAFSDSATIDADGATVWPSYKSYYATIAPDALSRTETFEADGFVQRFLSVKNIILNVSAVIWRRSALLEAVKACGRDLDGYRVAGDWRLYLQALSGGSGRVGYCAEPLNIHRRHATSVTQALSAEMHVAEIASCQAFAASAFRLSAKTQLAQSNYLQEVTRQLGVTQGGSIGGSTDDRRRNAKPPKRSRSKG